MSNIVKSFIGETEKKRLKESFDLMDSDADGYLDYHEMKAALKALGFTVKKSYVLAIILSQKLSKRSFIDEIKYAFKLFTNNSTSNKIMLDDLQSLNKKLECNLTLEEMELMIKEFDLDEDGSINESEFMDIMTDLNI